jgi:RimJ/RimL family protein N-acetyltransferase
MLISPVITDTSVPSGLPTEMQLPLHVGGMTIRRVSSNDFRDLSKYLSDPEVARYQFWEPYSAEQVAALIDCQAAVRIGDPGVALVLAVELDRQVIGDCELTIHSLDDRQAEIGFRFNPQFTGRGLATQAVSAALGFAFLRLRMHRVVSCTDVRNERSWRLMERVGMRREAHFIHDAYTKGNWVDDYVYAMLDHEWRERIPDLLGVVTLDQT